MNINRVVYSSPSSDVLSPIFNYWTTSSGQYGLVNIRYGASSNAETEQAIVEKVAGYGMQIGRVLDAVVYLAKHLGENDKTINHNKAILDLMDMNTKINVQKAGSAKPDSLTLTQFIESLTSLKDIDEESFKEVRDKLNEAIAKLS